MLEISARGRREKVGEEDGKRNVRGKEKVLKDGPVGRPPSLALYLLVRKLQWTQVLSRRGGSGRLKRWKSG